jgi:hypothetical protein
MKRKLPAKREAGRCHAASLLWVCVLGGVLFTASARAGDPIQFSTEKGKQSPVQERKIDNDLFKGWKREPTPNPTFGLTPYLPPIRLDRKEEKRLKNARDERRNFLLLQPGELNKDDDPLSGREYTDEGLEMEDQSSDYVFKPLIQRKSQDQRNANARQNPPPPPPSDDSVKVDGKKSLNLFGNSQGQPQGAHTVDELNLKNLINPAQIPTGNKSEATLADFFRDNAIARPSREQQERAKDFERFISASGIDPVVPSGRFDPINAGPDLTQQRLNPVLPSGNSGFDLPAPSRAPDLSGRPSFDPGSLNSLRPGSPLDYNATPRVPVGPSLPLPYAAPNSAPNSRPGGLMDGPSLFNRNFQKRPGSY